MIKPKVFHYSLSENVPYTFDFGVGCSTFLIKNLGTDIVQLSYGEQIDNDSYMNILPKTAETIFATAYSTPDAEVDKVTVLSVGNVEVEIRLLEY